MPLLIDSDFSSLCQAQNFIYMHEFQEKRIFLQKGYIWGENTEIFVLILIINQKLVSVRLDQTLGSEFRQTELIFAMCLTDLSCSTEYFGKSSAESNVRSPLPYFFENKPPRK